jgi:hypothetical protein
MNLLRGIEPDPIKLLVIGEMPYRIATFAATLTKSPLRMHQRSRLKVPLDFN